jgi:hypothetical protein
LPSRQPAWTTDVAGCPSDSLLGRPMLQVAAAVLLFTYQKQCRPSLCPYNTYKITRLAANRISPKHDFAMLRPPARKPRTCTRSFYHASFPQNSNFLSKGRGKSHCNVEPSASSKFRLCFEIWITFLPVFYLSKIQPLEYFITEVT